MISTNTKSSEEIETEINGPNNEFSFESLNQNFLRQSQNRRENSQNHNRIKNNQSIDLKISDKCKLFL